MPRHRLRWVTPVLTALWAVAFAPPASADKLPSLRVGPPAPAAASAPGPAERAEARLARAVAAARSRTGSAYAMGAAGPSAFDCSGLTTYAFARAGVTLPRTSQAQFAVGRAIERDEIRAGDLVFFSTNGPGASHVGVATGRTKAISATSSGGVMEHPTDDAYWGGSYVGARRPAAS
jgi:cell wall-associated NlpC family hydrolase